MEIEKVAFRRYMNNLENFDHKFYKKKYPDLRRLKNYQLLNHWKKFGFYENRICNENFKKDYELILMEELHKLLLNLKGKNYDLAYITFFYIIFLRKLTVFNPEYYFNNNKDIHKKYKLNNCIKHWRKNGIIELRSCSEHYNKLSFTLKEFATIQFDFYNYNLDKLKLLNIMDLSNISNINETIFHNKLLILELHNEIKIEKKKLIYKKLEQNNLKMKKYM